MLPVRYSLPYRTVLAPKLPEKILTMTLSENVQITTLPNGLRIVTETVPYVRSASVGLFVGIGSRDEDDSSAGISHFIEHMLFKGTKTRTAHQIADAIEQRGGHLNAWTDKEMTTYQTRVLAEDSLLALDILSDMLLGSLFDPEEITREKSVVIEEIKMYEDSPEDLVHEVFERVLWGKHPLGRPIIGSAETVSAISRDDIVAFIKNRYTPDRIVVSAAGGVNHDEIVAFAAERMGALNGTASSTRPKPPVPSGKSKAVRKRDTEQVNFCLGSHGYSKLSTNRYALSILNNVLGGNMSSRLFQEIREKRGLAYNIGTFARSYRDSGTFCVYGGTSPAAYGQVVELTNIETGRVRKEGITADELTKAKTQVRGALVLGLEGMSSRMNRYGESLLSLERIVPVEEVLAKYDAVSNDSIIEVAEYVFADGLQTASTIGPYSKRSKATAE
jgi:predicted Zn-dependent peptidase